MTPEFRAKFLTKTDDTGRFIVYSQRTGKTYYVEPIEGAHTPEWGSVDPATGKLMHKKGDGKHRGGIRAAESLITPENGFLPEKITMLDVGVSPHLAIDAMDAKYPSLA